MPRRILREMSHRAIQLAFAGLLILVCVVFPTKSLASGGGATYTVGLSSGRPAFGNLVVGSSGSSTYTETPAGSITPSGGGDFDPHAGSRTILPQTITINCNDTSSCTSQNVRIQVTLGTLTGRITSATMTAAMGSAVLVSGTTTGTSLDFTIGPVGRLSSKTFTLGFTINVSNSGTTASTVPYSIVASGATKDISGTNASQATATIYKGLTLSAPQNLNFGAIVVTGAGTVSLNALGTTRVATGGVTLLKSQSSNPVQPAWFTIDGESGVNVTVAFTTQPLTGAGTAMTFSANSCAVGVITLPVTTSNSSCTTLPDITVGGSVTVGATQAPGVYTGGVTMTVNYN